MTTTISSKGQVVIPQAVRERHQLQPGDNLLLIELSNGDIILRRARPPKKSLVWHLRRLHGLKLQRKSDDFIAPARRAFRRVARQLRTGHAKSGSPLIFGDNGKVKRVRPR
jgi:AbrB family looped-hinge helix DNA binding protein